ncbi:hypothetical protein [Streptomyces sp. NPDC047097]|uniref:hypothetical protein n=1 Tax=Streptomyces sp. NPDC047097 TaxID=3155260 RepID=UPI0033D54C1A
MTAHEDPETTLRTALTGAGLPDTEACRIIDAHAQSVLDRQRRTLEALRDLLYVPLAADKTGQAIRPDLALARATHAHGILNTLLGPDAHLYRRLDQYARQYLADLPARYRVLGTTPDA